MSKTKTPVPLRDQIIRCLLGRTDATAKQITQATTERDFPSRVANELNKLRADAVVECAKKPGKNELWYWLACPTDHARPDPDHGQPQPEVGENTGSDGSALTPVSSEAEAVAVPEPAPGPAAPSAGPVAEDDPVDEVTGLAEPSAEEHQLLEQAVQICDLKQQVATLTAAADQVHALLAERVAGAIDPADLSEVECAVKAAEMIDNAVDEISGLQLRMAEKDQQLRAARFRADELEAKLARTVEKMTNEALRADELLDEVARLRGRGSARPQTADMVNHPPHYQGKVEAIDAIEAALGTDGFAAYCRGNAMKYTWRAGKKGDPVQDLKKAAWYLARLTESDARDTARGAEPKAA